MRSQSGKLKQILTTWLVPSALSVGALLLFLLLTYPKAKAALATRTEIAKNQDLLREKLAPKVTFLENLNEQKLRSDLDQVILVLPIHPNPPLLLATIEEAASRAGIKVGSLQYQKTSSSQTSDQSKAPTGVKVISLGFLLEGDEARILEFLQTLFQTAPVLKFESVSVDLTKSATTSPTPGQESGEQEGSSTGSVVVDFFDSPLPANLPQVTEDLPELTKDEQAALVAASGFSTLMTLANPNASNSQLNSAATTPALSSPRGKPNPF